MKSSDWLWKRKKDEEEEEGDESEEEEEEEDISCGLFRNTNLKTNMFETQ